MTKQLTKYITIIILILCPMLLTSCQTATEEPDMKFFSDDNDLDVIYYLNKHNKEEDEIEDRLKDSMVGKRFIDLPVIKINGQVVLESLNFQTDEFEIYDYIMDERGNIISDYDAEPYRSSADEDYNGKYMLVRDEYLERYRDYAVEGKLIHGLLIRCEINKSSFAFATIVLGEMQ